MIKIEKIYGLGTYWWFDLLDDLDNYEIILTFIKKTLQEFESKYSRFIENSELSILNITRILYHPDQEILDLLEIASQYYILSEGYFNPALGSILENRGYDKDYSFQKKSVLETVFDFNQMVHVSKERIELILDGSLDFGGFGKGYLIDKLASDLKSKFGLKNFVINGGGDIIVISETKHEILLENPFSEGYSFLSLGLQNQALGCSSNTKRNWKDVKTGQEFAHIINPNQLNQVSKVGSFIIAKNALTADILATLVCIHFDNPKEIKRLQNLINFEYLILDRKQRIISSPGFEKFVI